MQDMAHLVGPAAQKSALQEPQILPEAVLRRLPRYYQCLLALYAQGQGRIRSTTLAGYLGMLPAQVRRDMRLLQAQGRRGYGYHVLPLLDRLGRLLGLKEGYRAVLYTEGGQAISAAALARGGFSLLAVASPAGQEEEAGWPHLAPGELYAFCQREAVQLLLYAGQAPVPQLPAQVRRDMRLLQAQGRRGYGYHVLPLLDRLGRLLGLKEGYRAVLYTEGGQAISAAALARGGFSLLAVASPAGQEEEAGWPHLAPGELYAFCQREAVQLLLYAGQAPVPQLDLAALAAAGVRAVLNLSEAELPAQDGLYIYNFRLTDALMALSLSLRWGLHGGCAPAGGTEEGGAPS